MHADLCKEEGVDMNSTSIDYFSNPTGSWYGFIGIICIALIVGVILWWYMGTLAKNPTNEKDD